MYTCTMTIASGETRLIIFSAFSSFVGALLFVLKVILYLVHDG